MHINLRYRRDGLPVRLPDDIDVRILRMGSGDLLPDPLEAVRRELASPTAGPPLNEIGVGKRTAAITISDITRPVPHRVMLPPMLDVLNDAGIPDTSITVIIGTGLHRPNSDDELCDMVGSETFGRVRFVNHMARDRSTLSDLGHTSRGTPVYINSEFVDADLHIATSLIEPHLMAGYSGGRKAVCPGLAGAETMRIMHGPVMLDHANAREGILDENPFHEEATEIACMARVDFALMVSLDEGRNLTGVFGGELIASHGAGCRHVEERVSAYVDEPCDVIITTSAGYPLDLTFYQSVKAMTAAVPVVKQGGTIIVASGCSEGVGSHDFTELMHGMRSADQFRQWMRQPDNFVIDQWQLQCMCRALDTAEILYYTDGLPASELENLLVTPVPSVEEGLDRALRRHGRSARVAVIPDGPYVLAKIGERA
jgi:lactate racemase